MPLKSLVTTHRKLLRGVSLRYCFFFIVQQKQSENFFPVSKKGNGTTPKCKGSRIRFYTYQFGHWKKPWHSVSETGKATPLTPHPPFPNRNLVAPNCRSLPMRFRLGTSFVWLFPNGLLIAINTRVVTRYVSSSLIPFLYTNFWFLIPKTWLVFVPDPTNMVQPYPWSLKTTDPDPMVCDPWSQGCDPRSSPSDP